MKIHVLRHCDRQANNVLNADLTQKGVEQAKQIEGYFDLVFVSTLKRTVKTFKMSKIKYDRVLFSDLFREKRGESECDYLDNELLKPETREGYEKRFNDAKQLILAELKKNPEIKILVVSHIYFIQKLSKGKLWLNPGQMEIIDLID